MSVNRTATGSDNDRPLSWQGAKGVRSLHARSAHALGCGMNGPERHARASSMTCLCRKEREGACRARPTADVCPILRATPRPSLSDRHGGLRRGIGIVSPGFTPRPSLSGASTASFASTICPVSPGFTPRPSLSAQPHRPALRGRRRVSPGFTPRPSLSGDHCLQRRDRRNVSPGFTPRPSLSARRMVCASSGMSPVSPGFTPRPSLSVRLWRQ